MTRDPSVLYRMVVSSSIPAHPHRAYAAVLISSVIQERSGGWPWKKLVMASTSTVYVDLTRKRHVSRSDRIRSTQRLPLALAVPRDRLRQRTPNRKARSARLLVASTPWWA